jgi:predicted transposase YbfD/YdcC
MEAPRELIFGKHFSELKDPRKEDQVRHKLMDIFVIAICGIICGADGWKAIEAYGKAKMPWLRTFLELPHGIPSHDTFGRVFSLISPVQLEKCFLSWVQDIVKISNNQVIPIDGKTLRRSHHKSAGKKAIHMVSAWAAANHVVLGQLKTEEKSNEITAIPELLKLLDIKGAIITIDAMGCQKKIAGQVVKQGGDYVLAVKGNQPDLHDGIMEHFAKADAESLASPAYDYHATEDHKHGRLEIRRCWVTNTFNNQDVAKEWPGLATIGVVESERHVDNKVTTECRYYISSLPEVNAERFIDIVRQHWGIENQLHWVLDLAFREDESRVRIGHAAENLAVLRHIALNLLQSKKGDAGTKIKRLQAGWDDSYLANILFA